MICLGNICRSPLAEGILKDKAVLAGLDWKVDSAGTSGWHDGERPDSRAIHIAEANGIHISNQYSRSVEAKDFDSFDLLLAMDQENYQKLMQLAPQKKHKNKIKLALDFVYPDGNRAVPDPYYDGNFQRVYDLLDRMAESIIKIYQ